MNIYPYHSAYPAYTVKGNDIYEYHSVYPAYTIKGMRYIRTIQLILHIQ